MTMGDCTSPFTFSFLVLRICLALRRLLRQFGVYSQHSLAYSERRLLQSLAGRLFRFLGGVAGVSGIFSSTGNASGSGSVGIEAGIGGVSGTIVGAGVGVSGFRCFLDTNLQNLTGNLVTRVLLQSEKEGSSTLTFSLLLVLVSVEGVVGCIIKSDNKGGRHFLIRNRLYNISLFLFIIPKLFFHYTRQPPSAHQKSTSFPKTSQTSSLGPILFLPLNRPREYNLIMPKYVPKEDVEKGLVDPTKPLEEQPQYKEKIEKETQERQKLHEDKRPHVVRPKKERPPRNPRPKFNYNKDDITETTQPPEAPKKLLEKPNKEKHLEGLEKLKAQRNPLQEQKKALIDEQRNLIRDLTESKKTGRLAITQYSGAMREKYNVVSQLSKEIRALDDIKKRVAGEIDELQGRFNQLSKPNAAESYSLEELQYRIQQKEHQLTTSDINKREEARLYNEINELKRALQKARPSIEIESEIGKLKDQIDILYKELKSIKSELHVKITENNKLRAELEQLEKQKKGEQGQVAEQRTVEDIKKEYDEKIKAVEARRDALEDKIDDYIDKYNRDLDNWEDQQDLLHYIDWVKDQVERLKRRREEEERRKKEKEEYEKRKLKEKEEYEKRKEERKKAEEERKAREEERRQRLQKQREVFINRNPNYQEIDLCETLVSYCNGLRPNAFQVHEKREKAPGPIVFGKEWQKEIKGGAVVITSKKSNLDEQAPKKEKKQKKKEEKPEDEDFHHGIEVINQFQKLKLLPPNNPNEIDSTIKLLQEKMAFFNNPTEEQRNAFKIKAAAEWDERHAPRETKRGEYKEKQDTEGGKTEDKAEKTEKPKRKEKKELSEQDFPGLG